MEEVDEFEDAFADELEMLREEEQGEDTNYHALQTDDLMTKMFSDGGMLWRWRYS